jgi:hypothetical protein
MILSIHCNLQKPLVVKATRLLVTYEDGTPAALLVSYSSGHIRVIRAGDKDFNEQLRMHNVHQTVVVSGVDMSVGSPNIFRGDK